MSKKIKGFDKVINKLNKEIRKVEGRSLKGLIRAAVLVSQKMDKKIPVDTGNLRASRFILTAKSIQRGKSPQFNGDNADVLSSAHAERMSRIQRTLSALNMPVVAIGFTAFYAPFVHEMVGANFQRPGAEAKFLESTLKENKQEILDIIVQEAKIK